MKAHGLKPVYYELDRDLQPNAQNVLSLIKKEKPAFLVLFHAVGITNHLVTREFMKLLPDNLFIIEDAVHRIVEPSRLKLFHERHICMNSIRKVVPLQGSFLYGRISLINRLQGPERSMVFYTGSVIFLWGLMQLYLLLQAYTPFFIHLKSFWGRLAEFCMLKGYDLIGDFPLPGSCPSFFSWLYLSIDGKKIKHIKKKQIALYTKILADHGFMMPYFSSTDVGELRGLPLFFSKKRGLQFISQLRGRGIMLRGELEGCPWTRERTIVYLPLGPYLKQHDIEKIGAVCVESVRGSLSG
jgi:hypothetical protein